MYNYIFESNKQNKQCCGSELNLFQKNHQNKYSYPEISQQKNCSYQTRRISYIKSCLAELVFDQLYVK